jgi:Uma2 family endonuclease
VIAGSRRGTTAHATTAALVIEVADTSPPYDATTKAELYAPAGIADYWVLDVDSRQLLVFRDPTPIPEGGADRDQKTFGPNDSVSPLAAPNATFKVADLLP